MILQLIHPKLGVCQNVETKSRRKTILQWKYLYGKKFLECKVKEIKKKRLKRNTGLPKSVMYIPTGEIFESIASASKNTGYSKDMITHHAHNRLVKGGRRRKFKFYKESALYSKGEK